MDSLGAAIGGFGSRQWWLVAGSLIIAFLARAPLYLAVFPPFEGWDEYQHLAYIAYLDDVGTIPVYDSRVPFSLRPLLNTTPHPLSGSEQLQPWGALSYNDYWNAADHAAAPDATASSAPRLYQSQQPPLAYVLALPTWRWMKTAAPLNAIYALRAMNLLVVAAALVLLAGALQRLVPAFAPRVAVLALVCLHPLFFENVARVANDGLAVATGVAGISLVVLADRRTLLTRGLLAAGALGASVWTKQTSLTLIPALAFGLPLIGWAHGASARRAWRISALACAAFLLIVAPLWVWNYQHYQTILTTQDSVELTARGSAVAALTAALTKVDWTSVIDLLFVPGRPWVGGWSFLPVQPTLDLVYRWYWTSLVVAAAVGGAVAARRWVPVERAAAVSDGNRGTAAELAVCGLVVIFTALGMAYHAVLSQAVYGRVMTTPWYFMTALPFLFVLVLRGLAAINGRVATAAAVGLAVLFVAMDVHGTWVQMPTAYGSTTDVALQWTRLSSVHPAILRGDLRWAFLALQLGALGLVAGVTMRMWPRSG